MDVKNLMQNAASLNSYEFERKLNKLVRENYRYRNLDSNNRAIILALVKKYKERLRKGLGMSYLNLRDEMYKLNKDRLKLNLTEEDLKDIKEILEKFKK